MYGKIKVKSGIFTFTFCSLYIIDIIILIYITDVVKPFFFTYVKVKYNFNTRLTLTLSDNRVCLVLKMSNNIPSESDILAYHLIDKNMKGLFKTLLV